MATLAPIATRRISLLHRALNVSVVINRARADVWAEVRDIASHVAWMHDAVAIRFLTDSVEGIGTRFECDTKVGPFSLTDVMEITEWDPERRIGVRHVGLVEGTGRFELSELGPSSTHFSWTETLTFSWWMGGPLGAFAARPVLGWIWRRNLVALKQRLERT